MVKGVSIHSNATHESLLLVAHVSQQQCMLAASSLPFNRDTRIPEKGPLRDQTAMYGPPFTNNAVWLRPVVDGPVQYNNGCVALEYVVAPTDGASNPGPSDGRTRCDVAGPTILGHRAPAYPMAAETPMSTLHWGHKGVSCSATPDFCLPKEAGRIH